MMNIIVLTCAMQMSRPHFYQMLLTYYVNDNDVFLKNQVGWGE